MPVRKYFYAFNLINTQNGALCRVYSGVCSSDEGAEKTFEYIRDEIVVREKIEYIRSEFSPARLSPEMMMVQFTAFNNVE